MKSCCYFIISLFFLPFQTQVMNANHYVPVFSGNPYSPMSILITKVTVDNLNLDLGDEIGVFDGKICVGSVSYDGNAMIGISVSMADVTESSIDGFKQGDPIYFKIWKKALNLEYRQIKTSYNASFDTLFRAFGTSVLELTANSSEQKPVINSNQSFFVSEKAQRDTIIGTVEAEIPLGKFCFGFIETESANPFIIDTLTGVISVRKPELLNYDVTPKYSLAVRVYCKTNTALSDTSVVLINVVEDKTPPVIADIRNDTAYVGLPYRKTVKIIHFENNSFKVIPISVPYWLTFGFTNNEEITFEGIPGIEDIGQSEISFLLSDGTTKIQRSFTLKTIQEGLKSEVIINNNPTSGPFTLFIDQCKDKEIVVLIRKLDGNIIYKNELQNTFNQLILPIDLSVNIRNVYIVEVAFGNRIVSKKIILQ